MPGLNYVRIVDNAGKTRQDCTFFLEPAHEELPPPMPYPDDKNLVYFFSQRDHLVLQGPNGQYLATIWGSNAIETTDMNAPSGVQARAVRDLQLF
jgi:hypothetical protein